MASLNVACQRLHSQHIVGTRFEKPDDVVKWLGAVQAQDYLGSLWAIGLRMQSAPQQAVEQALARREIVRTWPMRGTLHLVAAADVRWMLELMTPRVVASNARRFQQQFDLDDAVLLRSRKVLECALQGGRQLSRSAVYWSSSRPIPSPDSRKPNGAPLPRQHISTVSFWDCRLSGRGQVSAHDEQRRSHE
jgi:hypothetical protein